MPGIETTKHGNTPSSLVPRPHSTRKKIGPGIHNYLGQLRDPGGMTWPRADDVTLHQNEIELQQLALYVLHWLARNSC